MKFSICLLSIVSMMMTEQLVTVFRDSIQPSPSSCRLLCNRHSFYPLVICYVPDIVISAFLLYQY